MPDASMPHSSGPEVGEELTEGRAVCERCRRPKAERTDAVILLDHPSSEPLPVCTGWTSATGHAECDRLLLAERDALAKAGDALAESIGLASPSTHRALIRWRELRGERHG